MYINVATLKSLPNEQFVSGMGEVIKHGIIRDSEFFDYIEKNSDKIKTLDNETLIKMDKINCSIKADVVGAGRKRKRTSCNSQFRSYNRSRGRIGI